MAKQQGKQSQSQRWSTLVHSVGITALVLGLFAYWFVIADRYHIFLYGHLGAGPFDAITRSRYWMAGLVAAGIVLVCHSICNWMLGRLAAMRYRRYTPPRWWQIWLVTAPLLTVGILFITIGFNFPRLPFAVAAACVASTLCGLAIALPFSTLAANQVRGLFWRLLFGVALTPLLLLLRAVELPQRGILAQPTANFVAIGGGLLALLGLALLVALRGRLRRPPIRGISIWLAGLAVSYLLLPLLHYLLLVPPQYRYITAAVNVFASTVTLQLCTLAFAALLAWSADVSQRLLHRKLIPDRSNHEST